MNIFVRLEYELAYYDSAVHRFNHYTTRTPPVLVGWGCCFFFGGVVCVSFLCAFLIFCSLVFVGFLLFSKDAIFRLSRFSLISIASYGILHLILDLVGMHLYWTSIWAATKSSYSLFGVCLKNISWRVSNLFLTVTIYWFLISLLESEDQLYCWTQTACVLFPLR